VSRPPVSRPPVSRPPVSRQRGIGLVSSLVEKDAFDDEVGALARRLASGPVQAYAQTKALLTREQDMSLSAAIELEAVTQALLMKGRTTPSSTRRSTRAARRGGRAADP
jgi:enoyl-CoA hydratase/carnithine racemase